MEDISADTVPQQRVDRHEARRRRQARALEIVRGIGQPKPAAVRPPPSRPPRPVIEEQDAPGWEVYFLYGCNRIKIGTSRNHIQRVFSGISPYCPAPLFLLGVIPGGHPTERRLHERFEDTRAHDEWFDLDADLRAFLLEDAGRAKNLAIAERFYREWLEYELGVQKGEIDD